MPVRLAIPALFGLATGLLAAPVPKAVAPAEHQKNLREAGDLQQKRREADERGDEAGVRKFGEQFAEVVRKLVPNLTAVKPEETATPKEYVKLALNAGKTKFDAFRFTAPEGKVNWNLDWEFVYAKGTKLRSWSIQPAAGTMPGFTQFRTSENWMEDFADLPQHNIRVTQDLPGGRLVPGAEYVIWFAFEDEKPVEVFLRLGVTPSKK